MLAWPAVVAGGPAVDRLREVGRPTKGHGPAELGAQSLPNPVFDARHPHRWMESAVGHDRISALVDTGDADVLLDDVVVRREIRVGEWPVDAMAVPARRLEVDVAETVALTTPHVGAPADHTKPTHPGKRLVIRRGVGLVDVVGEPVVVPLATRVAVLLLRPRPADHLVGTAAIGQGRRRDVLLVVGIGQGPAGLQHADSQAGLAETFRGPATGRTRPDDDGIERLSGHLGGARHPRLLHVPGECRRR